MIGCENSTFFLSHKKLISDFNNSEVDLWVDLKIISMNFHAVSWKDFKRIHNKTNMDINRKL